ncbi:methyltransferase family protein [Prochlorococcus marinus]|nr:isoprenylcysteine carboxylmethyltransferase family protein [Prochlorococcus marinus]
MNNRNGEWWLAIQLAIIAAHLAPTLPSHKSLYGMEWPITLIILGGVLFSIGNALAIITLIKLGKSLSPLPQPKKDADLVTSGIYRFSRHPLYLSLIMISIGYILIIGSLFHVTLLIGLCIVLINKAKLEEAKLKEIHPQYNQYIYQTPAIIKGLLFFDWRH